MIETSVLLVEQWSCTIVDEINNIAEDLWIRVGYFYYAIGILFRTTRTSAYLVVSDHFVEQLRRLGYHMSVLLLFKDESIV